MAQLVKLTITLSGAIAIWARARGFAATKKDCDELAEAIMEMLRQTREPSAEEHSGGENPSTA